MVNIVNWIKQEWSQYQENKLVKEYLSRNGSTHCCPKCNKWEHEGNTIYTEIYCDQTDKRTCTNCGYVWRSLFCPAGHVWLEGYIWNGEEFVESE